MSCLDEAPEFIEEDNRRFRSFNPVSAAQMLAKHEAILPPDLVKGKSILDLGSCTGITGHWCLSHGASHYTGLEAQHGYAELSNRLLGKYHPGKFTIVEQPIERWITGDHPEPYDIVCLLGVLYAFSDYFFILKRAAALARSHIIVEGIYPRVEHPEIFCGAVFLSNQAMNLADQHASVMGRGALLSPKGAAWVMEEFGFTAPEGVILPKPITDVPDIYNRTLSAFVYRRYLMRFQKSVACAKTLSENIQEGTGRIEEWTKLS